MDEIRETIEERREQATAGPNEPQYDQMEQAAAEAKQEAEQHPSWTQGEDIPTQDVPEDERLTRPVATETDSY
ncbi:MAG TPA: hypothetical protein VKX16_16540 [Chloroflexota bacterium]|nr:hypothetical protein [Chloroflexota bacterium]